MKGFKQLVGWLPLLSFVVVLALRFIKGRRVRFVFYFLGILTPAVVLFGFLFLSPATEEYRNRQSFDAEIWLNHDQVEQDPKWPIRLQMVDDLLEHHLFIGMGREQLITLLGEPSQAGFSNKWDIVYLLGPERGFLRLDSEWLVFRFDEHNQVVENLIVTD